MPRIRLLDFRTSRASRVLGHCKDDLPSMANYANTAERRLVFARESGDEGWWGSFAEVSFNNVSRLTPYLTMPREIARIEAIDVCDHPVRLNNQYAEYLQFGNGRLPKLCCTRDRWYCLPQAMTRNNVITFVDQTVFPCLLRVYTTNAADNNGTTRILFQGLDSTNSIIYSQDGQNEVQGVFLTMDSPFAQTTQSFNRITGIQKDLTVGEIQIMQVDPTTGDETLILTMQPGETVAGYRRYYLNNLPDNCCQLTNVTLPQNLRITAMVKLEPIPVVVDTDYFLLHNLEALIEEAISVRMSEMDNLKAQQLAGIHHINAIRLLNSEISHYLGKQNPAVNFAPFGSARLERQRIGTMI